MKTVSFKRLNLFYCFYLDFSTVWLLETRILSSIGVFCGVLGFIGTVVFMRREARSRCAGLLACISLSISGNPAYVKMLKYASSIQFHNVTCQYCNTFLPVNASQYQVY